MNKAKQNNQDSKTLENIFFKRINDFLTPIIIPQYKPQKSLHTLFLTKNTYFCPKYRNMEAVHIDSQNLLSDADRMPVTELERLLKDISALLRRKKTQDKDLRERQLLHKINNTVLNTTQIERYHALVEKLEWGTMTDAEHTEFDLLGNKEEKLRNQRVKYMIELAQLRAVSLTEVMTSLGLKPLIYA